MRSDSAQFFAARAARRAAMSASTSAGVDRERRAPPRLPVGFALGEEAERAQIRDERLALARAVEGVQLGDRLRRVEVVRQRLEHGRREARCRAVAG